jgi:chain length determinant protein EpsF
MAPISSFAHESCCPIDNMTISQIALILHARWRSAVVTFLVIIGLVGLVTLVMPRSYTGTGAVVLDVKSPDPIAGVVLPGMVVSSYMATQVDVMQSERVIRRAIHTLGLEKDADLRAVWQDVTEGQGDFETWLAARILKKLDVKPGKESNVIVVQYTNRDAELAAKTANAIVNAYIETTLELRTEPAKQFNAQFQESTKALREELESAQKRLSQFQQRNGITVTDERIDVENSRLNELAAQVTQVQSAANESSSKQAEAARKGEMQEVLTNPMIMTLTASVSMQEARLHELRQRLGEQNPQVIDLRANIKELRDRLGAEKSRIVGGITANNTVNQSHLESLRKAMEDQRERVLKLKAQRDESNVLQRDLDNAQRGYDAAFAKRNQSNLESQATQTNVSVIQAATTPAFPSSPRIILNIAIGLVLGMAIAFAVAVMRERRDWRLRTDADVLEALNQPLLGVLPDRQRLPSSGRTLRLMAQRVMSRPKLIGQ